MRQPRTVRHRGLVVQLTERDRYVLEVLDRFRIARTSDLIRTCFPGAHRQTATMRLRRLFDAGHIRIHSAQIGSETVYRGKAKIPRGSILHHLATVGVWSQLVGRLDLCRAYWALHSNPVIPDLFAVISGHGFAIEVDRGNESRPTIQKKIATYAQLQALYGYPFNVVLVPEGSDPWLLLRPLLPQQEALSPNHAGS